MDVDQVVMPTTPAVVPWLHALRLAERRAERGQDVSTHLNRSTCWHNCNIADDLLTVEYIGIGRDNQDVGAAQGNHPVPQKRLLYYFELFVEDAGISQAIAIGFTDKSFPMYRMPGWEPGSYGYHGDDGKLFHGLGIGDAFGPTFSTGDTVGAGINYATQEILFTVNGLVVGRTAFEDTDGPFYPTVGLHSQNQRVVVNFGQKPFVFDVVGQEDLEREQRSFSRPPQLW